MNIHVNEILMKGARYGKLELVEYALEKGADVETNNSDGWTTYVGRTPLQLASRYGFLEVVKALLKNRAPVDAKNYYGKTPLDTAIDYGDSETIKLLKYHIKSQEKQNQIPVSIKLTKDEYSKLKNILKLYQNQL